MMNEDCVHREACCRCKERAEKENAGKIFLWDCWNCELYVSRYELMEWWYTGGDIREKICSMKAYARAREAQERRRLESVPF